MSYSYGIPGYVQGHRLSDESELFYDATNKRFKDLAGYGDRNDLVINVGTPVFETVDGNRCVKLNNTFHGIMPCPIPWMGSVVAVIKPMYVSGGTLLRYPMLMGDAVSASSNGQFQVLHFGGSRRVALVSPSASLAATKERADNNLVVVAFAFDQSTRKGYSTSDGITVTETTASASTTNGLAPAVSTGLNGIRFGNMNGVAGDTTEITDVFAYMYEYHFYSGNILTENLAETKGFMDTLKAKYGV